MRRPRSPGDLPPPLEIECLKALWDLGEGNVHEVRARMARPLAYTTVMTLLERLVRRGKLSRGKRGRGYLYAPLISRDELRQAAIQQLAASLFGGDLDLLRGFLAAEAAPAAAPPAASLDATLL